MTTAIEPRLPKQVQAAAEKARQILERQRAQREKPAAPDGVQVIEQTEVPIPSLAAQPQPGSPPAAPSAPPSDEDGRDLAYWKHRAKTLDGALKSAKDKHAAIVSDLQSQIALLREELQAAKDAAAAAAPIKLDDYFSQEEIDTLGEAEARILAAKIAKAQREAIVAARAEMKAIAPQPTAPAPTPTAAAAAPSPEDEFYDELDRLVPNWEQINKDKRWLAFCGTVDEETGFTIQELLNAAQERLNAPAAAKLFRRFERSLNVVASPPPAVAPNVRTAGGREPSNPPPPAAAAGRPSKAEIAEHFKNRSLYHHKPEHPKHVSDAEHKAFLERLQSAA